MLRVLFDRWNERRKLAKGRCVNCGAVLRDDATDPYCSDECAEQWRNATVY